ncbi:PSP1 domain-containing protein [Deinococcus yavapaiensis]|uniref:Cell fate regulator YaaT (PSP1 superfamily) n=1 Tax=Deinococcus yavapaiensis KR-236 TaxID=694435 RepID=A0A318SDD3_9DEIO|nr:stage 0 sporulation family protein [Deinococcus yavapaiensis]PYE54459.1 cell fate regulator YaaT (PSP1 superfamily) [Deinococcus yavapaiensis KR-236]
MFIQAVRFDHSPQLHDMNADVPYDVGARVVVQSRRGLEMARVRGEPHLAPSEPKPMTILRTATPEDLETHEQLVREGEDLKWLARARARSRGLSVKIVSCEFTLDGALLTISYSADERIELGNLVQDLRSHTKAKINFLAVGPREQAMTIGALGACGRENCSSTHLQDFAPVSIRMARDQQLPLNPEKLSGPCGRLLCCLQFEHTMYQELLKELPRKNAKVCHTESGACGKVVKLNPLAGTVDVYTDAGLLAGVKPDELTPWSGNDKNPS